MKILIAIFWAVTPFSDAVGS